MAANLEDAKSYGKELRLQNEDYITHTGLPVDLQPGECHPLHWACSGGHSEILRYLLDVCNISVDMQDNNGLTPLMIASAVGHEGIVKILIRKNADLRKTDYNGKTALHYAVSNNRVKIADMLILNNAGLDAVDYITGATALYHAALKGHLAIARSLVEHKCQLDIQNVDGDTPLHVACREEWEEVALLLLRSGASTTLRNKANLTAPYVASSYLRRILDGHFNL